MPATPQAGRIIETTAWWTGGKTTTATMATEQTTSLCLRPVEFMVNFKVYTTCMQGSDIKFMGDGEKK